MSDVFNVTASYNAPAYTKGQTIIAAIVGSDTETVTSQGQVGPLALSIAAADGATEVVNMPAAAVTISNITTQAVKITGVVDTSPTPRTWVISSDGLSASAVA
jgi:hypothetical protein